MDRRLLIEEFRDEIKQRADARFGGKLHCAFVDWYVEAEFGNVNWTFTDDVSDGGIDAVIWRPEESPPVILIQSKFTDRIGTRLLSSRAYKDFDQVVESFFEGDDAFDALCNRAREDVRRTYRKAYKLLQEMKDWRHERKAFRLITTANGRHSERNGRIPRDAYVHADSVLSLYEQYRKGATPTAPPLTLTTSGKLIYSDGRQGVSAALFNARVYDFVKYLDACDVSRLVARNIRYSLGGKVGRGIRNTFEKCPGDFWYLHNGITIVCDGMRNRGAYVTLENPSVVNGAQTLYAVSIATAKPKRAAVTTRVIVRQKNKTLHIEDDEWIQNVIRGVNTQNRVHAYDFRANEPEQIELQNRFRDVRVFYERKRGEWKNVRNEPRYRGFDRISLKTLGVILTVTGDWSGDGVLLAKRSIDALFEERHYRPLFPSRSKVARRFERIYFSFRLYSLLRNYGYANARERKRQQHAFWNCLWLMHRTITDQSRFYSRTSIDLLRQDFDRFEASGATGRSTRSKLRKFTKSVWKAWRKARKIDPDRWTANNFFKSSFGNKTILRIALPNMRDDVKAIGRLMLH